MKSTVKSRSENKQTASAAPSSAETASFVDSRPEAMAQRRIMDMMNSSPRVSQLRSYATMMANSPRVVAQRQQMESLVAGAVQRAQQNEMGLQATSTTSPDTQLAPVYSTGANISEEIVQRAALANAAHMKPYGHWSNTVDGNGRVNHIEGHDLKLETGHGLPGAGHNAASASPLGWAWLNGKLSFPGNPPNYVRMHLLNGQMGGPGDTTNNLAPGTASLNSHHFKNFEDEAQSWLSQGGKIQNYVVNVAYNGASANLQTPGAKAAWKNTISSMNGYFDFIHYTGGNQQVSRAQFSAVENAGLDTQANWNNY